MAMECTSYPLAKSTGTRDEESEQEEKDTGHGQCQENIGYGASSRSPSLPSLVLPFALSIFPPQTHRHNFQLSVVPYWIPENEACQLLPWLQFLTMEKRPGTEAAACYVSTPTDMRNSKSSEQDRHDHRLKVLSLGHHGSNVNDSSPLYSTAGVFHLQLGRY